MACRGTALVLPPPMDSLTPWLLTIARTGVRLLVLVAFGHGPGAVQEHIFANYARHRAAVEALVIRQCTRLSPLAGPSCQWARYCRGAASKRFILLARRWLLIGYIYTYIYIYMLLWSPWAGLRQCLPSKPNVTSFSRSLPSQPSIKAFNHNLASQPSVKAVRHYLV